MGRIVMTANGKTLTLLLVACLAGRLHPVAARGQGADGARRPFLIVSEPYPPYEFVEDGQPVGINVEIVERVMERIGVPYVFRVDYPFTRVHMMLQSGRADAGLSISHQDFRESFLHFTEDQRLHSDGGPFPTNFLWRTEYVFFVSARYEKALHFESYEQIKRAGYRIGALREYSYDSDFRDADLQRFLFVTPRDALEALDRGEIDLLPLDRTVGMWIAKTIGLADRVTHLPKPLFSKPYLIVFSSHSDYPGIEGVQEAFYRELRAMRDSGEVRAIRNKFMPPDYPVPLPRPLLFVCEPWPPFEYEADNRVQGINVDVVKRIMSRLNLDHEVRVYPWSRAWMLVENGGADAVLSVSYASDREETLHFSPTQRSAAADLTVPSDHLWISEYVFFVMRRNLDRLSFDSYDQLKRDGVRVGVNRDYTYDLAFREANLASRQFTQIQDGLAALLNDEIDLYPMDLTVGLAELRRMGIEHSVTLLPRRLFRKAYLAAFSRKSDIPGLAGLMKDFYEELAWMRAVGEYDAIVSRRRSGGEEP